jgi:hypothetical protein
MNIPATLRAGDTIEWDESNSDYPASSGWTLAFVLTKYGQSLITITATADGDDYTVSVLPAVTRAWVAGIYSWQAYVYKASGTPLLITEKHTLDRGQIEILPDITQAILTTDLRSFAKKNLEMIEAALSGDTSPFVMGYSIAGRSLSKRTREELIKERSYWKIEYEREVEAEGIARGEDSPRRVGVRFRRL